MEAIGKIIEVLPERTGEGQNGPWRIASYVIELPGYKPTKFVFDVSDGAHGRIAALNIQKGKKYKIHFDIEGREYNGSWYNTVRCWGAQPMSEEPATDNP